MLDDNERYKFLSLLRGERYTPPVKNGMPRLVTITSVQGITYRRFLYGYPLIRWLTNIPTYLLMRIQHGIQ
jgi:hypothetical protein